MLIFVFLLLFFPFQVLSICDLPPDFWCDHPKTALECTGSLKYCDGYRASRAGQKLKLRLAMETGCPDSQQFVVYRLSPQVLTKHDILSMVDFKALPWGLAKREYENRVKCHHGPRECAGNRLMTCGLLYYVYNPQKYGKLLNCFMSFMMYKAIPQHAMQQCMDRVQTPPEAQTSILHCAEASQADELQKFDEFETSKILNTPRFVPYIAINDRSDLHMQAYQMFIGDKIKIWNRTLSLIAPTTASSSKCQLPSDFWCSDSSFTQECFNAADCSTYFQTIHGRPIQIKIIYDSNLKPSVEYILRYSRSHFQNDPKVILEIEPTPTPNCDIKTPTCQDHAIQECVATKIQDTKERTKMLMCLLENKDSNNGMRAAWSNRCHFLQNSFNGNLKDIVLNCANSNEWKTYSTIRLEIHQMKLSPEPKKSDPWLLINNHSLSSVQAYQSFLHYMICLWYRGPNHDRDACWRCSYEATHC